MDIARRCQQGMRCQRFTCLDNLGTHATGTCALFRAWLGLLTGRITSRGVGPELGGLTRPRRLEHLLTRPELTLNMSITC